MTRRHSPAESLDLPNAKRGPGRPSGPSGVLNTIEVLRSFTAQEPILGVTEIAKRIGLHRSSVSRILSALEVAGFVEREPSTGRFRLGPGLIALTGRMLSSLSIIDVAKPVLSDLANATGETASLSILNNDAVLVVDQIVGLGPIHITVPGSSPTHCTASGRVLLAFSEASVVDQILAKGLKAETTKTITREADLRRILSEVRRAGVAVVRGEFVEQLAGIASVILDHRGAPVASISVASPVFSLSTEKTEALAAQVQQAAERISSLLGYAPTDVISKSS